MGMCPFSLGKLTLNGRNFEKGVCTLLNYSASRINQYPSFVPNPALFFLGFYLYPLLVIIDS
jgi:hypothetical protein